MLALMRLARVVAPAATVQRVLLAGEDDAAGRVHHRDCFGVMPATAEETR